MSKPVKLILNQFYTILSRPVNHRRKNKMTLPIPVLNFTGEMTKLLIDGNEYEKLLDIDLKGFTIELKNLTSERLPRVSKTRCKHHNLVMGEGLSRRDCKREIVTLKEDIQTIKTLKEQYPKLRAKGLIKFPIPVDSLVGKAIKEFFEEYLNYINLEDEIRLSIAEKRPIYNLNPETTTVEELRLFLAEKHSVYAEAKTKLIMEYTRIILE